MTELCKPCPENKKPNPLDYMVSKKAYTTKTTECLISLLKSMTQAKYCDIPPEGCK